MLGAGRPPARQPRLEAASGVDRGARMSDYITRLEASFAPRPPGSTRKGNARWDVSGKVVRRGRARSVAGPVGVVEIAVGGLGAGPGRGSTAAAVAVLSTNSAPLTGTVPGLLGRLRYDIPLTPDLEPGDAGWCSYPIFAITGSIEDAGAGTCSPAVPPGAPGDPRQGASRSATSKRCCGDAASADWRESASSICSGWWSAPRSPPSGSTPARSSRHGKTRDSLAAGGQS